MLIFCELLIFFKKRKERLVLLEVESDFALTDKEHLSERFNQATTKRL